MSKRVVTELVDDIDGSPASASRELSIDGVSYAIDLNDEHAAQLDAVLAPYVAAGTKISRGVRRRHVVQSPARTPVGRSVRSASDRERMAAIRRWASEHGYEVSNRGRVSTAIIAAYDQAQQAPAPAPAKRGRRKAADAVFVAPVRSKT